MAVGLTARHTPGERLITILILNLVLYLISFILMAGNNSLLHIKCRPVCVLKVVCSSLLVPGLNIADAGPRKKCAMSD